LHALWVIALAAWTAAVPHVAWLVEEAAWVVDHAAWAIAHTQWGVDYALWEYTPTLPPPVEPVEPTLREDLPAAPIEPLDPGAEPIEPVEPVEGVLNSRPPPATNTRSVILMYLEEVIINGAADRIGQPKNEMILAGAPRTPIAEYTIVGVQTEHRVPTTILWGQDNVQPYLRSGFQLNQNEPFYNFPSGLGSYSEIDLFKFKNYLPLLVQDSKTEFSRDLSTLGRCIRIDEQNTDNSLAFSLSGQAQLGYFLRNDVDQQDKYTSTLDLSLPRFETQTIQFSELPVKHMWFTNFGIPDLLMIRVEQDIGNLSVNERDVCAEVARCKLSVFDQQESKLIASVTGHQFRELTRKNMNSFAAAHENVILLNSFDLGDFNKIDQRKEAIQFVFTLDKLNEPSVFTTKSKSLIITPVF
jgi:hypothetical protein